MKRILLTLGFCLLASAAGFGQTSPGWVKGYTPTASEWNSDFAKKQDYGDPVKPTDAAFGAKCDGTTDDTTALNSWFAYVVANNVRGQLPNATCKANSALTWDLSSRRTTGITIEGDSMGASVLDLRGVSAGVPLLITSTSGPAYYSRFARFTVLTAINGPGVEVGNPTNSDQFNGFVFDHVEFKDVNNNAAVIAAEVTGCYNCDFRQVVTNTGGGSTTNTGLGTSMQMQYVQFSRVNGSFSAAATGLYLTGGFVFGNIFEALDVEVTNVGVLIDTATVSKNTFVGGQFANYLCFKFTAGAGNMIIVPNPGYYAGGAEINTAFTTGMWLKQPGLSVSTPSVASTGVSTTNNTGRVVAVSVWGGTVTSIVANGTTYGTSGTVIVHPGETITLNYSAAPSWFWNPVE